MMAMERFGGSKLMATAGALGVLGLLATLGGMVSGSREAAHSYLIAFVYWCGISVAFIIMQAIFHTAKAKWMTVLRRTMETMGLSVGIFALLVLPILWKMDVLFPWVSPEGRFTAEELHHLHHKHAYLNVPFFLARQALYFGVWIFVAKTLHGWSTKQDETGELYLTVKLRTLSPGAIPFLALTMTFAGFDWLMTLTPLWQSTIFGVYYFAGSFLSAFCLLTIVTVRAQGQNLYGSAVTGAHYHNLGKLMLAFTAFWTYIAFSQFLLIWIANIPEEAGWFKLRMFGPWRNVSIALFFLHFVLPFAVLLSRTIKLMPKVLATVAVWQLAMHLLDIYWLVWPALSPESPGFHWTLLTAFVGVGGLAVATGLFLAKGRYTLPVKDPYISDSLRYVQP